MRGTGCAGLGVEGVSSYPGCRTIVWECAQGSDTRCATKRGAVAVCTISGYDSRVAAKPGFLSRGY
jgi:hypothetical protein